MALENAVRPRSRAEVRPGELDALIAELAGRQHGVVGRHQLTERGAGRRAVGHRIERARLHPIHRGVYAVGHRAISAHGRWMAAVLAGGPGAALSDRSAAALWQVYRSSSDCQDVTVWPSRRSRPSLCFHTRQLEPDEMTEVRGIPVTTVARTLLDLASVLDRRGLERAIHEAEARRFTGPLSLGDVLARHRHVRGAAVLTAILDAGRIGADVTRSELEDRFLAFLDEGGLRAPLVNTMIEAARRRIEVDCVWPDRRLIVELDGHATHATRRGYERDRGRDRALAVAGWRVVRITWRQLHEERETLAADLRALLGDH